MNLLKPQLLTGEGTLKGLEPPQSDEFDTQNYSVGIQKDEIEGDKIVEEKISQLETGVLPLFCQIMSLICTCTISCCLPFTVLE